MKKTVEEKQDSEEVHRLQEQASPLSFYHQMQKPINSNQWHI